MAAALLGAMTLARLCHELQVDFEVALFNRGFAARPNDTEWTYTRAASQAAAGLRQTPWHRGRPAHHDRQPLSGQALRPALAGRRGRPGRNVLDRAEPAKAAMAARRDPEDLPAGVDVREGGQRRRVQRHPRRRAHGPARCPGPGAGRSGRRHDPRLGRALRSSAVAAVERSGTTVLGIGIGDDTATGAYHRFEIVNRPEELTRAMIDGTRSALRRGLALWGMDTWWLRPPENCRQTKEMFSA